MKTTHHRIIAAFIVLLGGLFLLPTPLRSDSGGLMGVARDMATGEPVAGATIQAEGYSTRTDAQGRYSLPLAQGTYDVRAEAPGYIGMTQAAVQISGPQWASLDFEMIPEDPNPDELAALESKLTPPEQLPDGADQDPALQGGYQLSAVTTLPDTLRVLMPDGSIVVMTMDEYLKGVVPAEVPASWHPEALRAQAIAARSYAATHRSHTKEGADVCTTTHCQVWKPTHYDSTDRAVEDTSGVAAYYQGGIIGAFFFAHCDGHTREAQEAWQINVPYCQSVSCPCGFDTRYGHGVGMCQQGAQALAKMGLNHEQILRHYYTGIDVIGPSTGQLAAPLLEPTGGDENTVFVYRVTFTAQTQNAPVVANVLIDGRARAMTRVSGEGHTWQYELRTRLSAGTHSHRFYFDDGVGHVSQLPASGTLTGPTVTAANPAQPTPTPAPHGGVLVDSITHSTVNDWAGGTMDGVRVMGIGDGALMLEDGRLEGNYTSPPLTAPLPFVGLGLTWHARAPQGASLLIQVRTSEDGVTWRDWTAMPPTDDDEDSLLQSADLLIGAGVKLQYRVTLSAAPDGSSPILENLRLVCIDSRPGPKASDLAAAPRLSASTRPNVIPRSGWGADESLMTWPPEYRPIRAIVLHHTVTSDGSVDPAAVVRAIYYYHAVTREWGDIGYNYLIDAYGNIYEGRAGGVSVVGGHALQYNWGSIGIAILGDYQENPVPSAILTSLTNFAAWQCADHFVPPTEQRYFIDKVLPAFMGHRDGSSSTVCPGDYAYALLPSIRAETLSKMASVPPNVRMTSPVEGQALRGVVTPALDTSAVIHRVEYWVDGVLRATKTAPPYTWKWNTTEEGEGAHQLRVVAYNSAGQDQQQVQVTIDNTPPTGSVSVPTWVNSANVPFALDSPDATAVQFSNSWVWEGESLYHQPNSGLAVADNQAANGQTWLGRGGVDQAGVWYGPYTCELPDWRDYQVFFRLKTTDRSRDVELALLDIADDQGRRVYIQRSLMAADLAKNNTYEELRLDLAYKGCSPTCDDPDISDGIEFRTAFRGNGDLYLDRISVFGIPRPAQSPVAWDVRAVEGPQTVLVRLLDAAGNASEQAVTVRLDLTPPQWSQYGERSVWVQDTLSGLDTESAAWTASTDWGHTWGEWQPLAVEATAGTTAAVKLTVPEQGATNWQFRIKDRAGNVSESALHGLPTPTPTATMTPTPPPTLAPTNTPSAWAQIPLVMK